MAVDMHDTMASCHINGSIRAAVIDKQDLNSINSVDLLWQLRQGCWQGLRFVQAWNLDY